LPERRRSTIRGRSLVRAAAAVVAILFIASGVAIWLLRQDALADAEAENHRLGVVLAEQTTRTVQAADFVLQELSGKIIDSGITDLASLHKRFGGQDLREALTRRLSDLPQVVSFIIADSAGRLVNITGPQPGPDWSVADRPYFVHFATTPDTGSFISDPSVGRASGVNSVFLARRISHRTAPSSAC
jgi:hypothetical protein